jgi:hypothetical protein
VTSDPILRHVFQPVVDVLRLRPSRAAAITADGFLITALALTIYRFASPGEVLLGWRVMHVAGAVMLHWWMRWCAANGRISMAGPLGTLHAVMRMGLIALTVLDIVTINRIVAQPDLYMPGSLMRAVLQCAEDMLGGAALYLSACTDPPPSRPRDVRSTT